MIDELDQRLAGGRGENLVLEIGSEGFTKDFKQVQQLSNFVAVRLAYRVWDAEEEGDDHADASVVALFVSDLEGLEWFAGLGYVRGSADCNAHQHCLRSVASRVRHLFL